MLWEFSANFVMSTILKHVLKDYTWYEFMKTKHNKQVISANKKMNNRRNPIEYLMLEHVPRGSQIPPASAI